MKYVVLQKAIADAGVASRRKAEEFILKGFVLVNKKKVTALGTRVDPDRDEITVRGKTIRKEPVVYFALNKPKGILSSVSDDRGRKTVVNLIKTTARIVPVGRLDIDTSGLILLTNDGDLVNRLTHPSFEKEKEYLVHVEVPKRWSNKDIDSAIRNMQRGVIVAGGFKTSPAAVKIVARRGKIEFELSVVIHEGKKHQIRRMVSAVGMSVCSLKRVRIGSVVLGDLALGAHRELGEEEIASLQK